MIYAYHDIHTARNVTKGAFMGASLVRLPDEWHDKILWLFCKEKRSQTKIIVEILQKALADVKVPKEAGR